MAIVRSAGSIRIPDVVQRNPKRIFDCSSSGTLVSDHKSTKSHGVHGCLSNNYKILAMSIENARVHVIVESLDWNSCKSALYQVYNLSGKLLVNQKMPISVSVLKSFSNNDASFISLLCPAEVCCHSIFFTYIFNFYYVFYTYDQYIIRYIFLFVNYY